jgi:hypothetical protein
VQQQVEELKPRDHAASRHAHFRAHDRRVINLDAQQRFDVRCAARTRSRVG